MRPRNARSLSAALALFFLAALAIAVGTAAAPAAAEGGAECRFPADLAARLLAGDLDFGDLPMESRFTVDEQMLLDEGRVRATVEGKFEAGPLELVPEATVCVFLLLDVDGEAILAHQQRLDLGDFASIEALRYVLRADLPEGTRHMTFVVREAVTGIWGAVPLEQPEGPIDGPSFTAVRIPEREGTWYEVSYRQGAGGGGTRTAATPGPAGGDTGTTADAAAPGTNPNAAGAPQSRPAPPRGAARRGSATDPGKRVIRLVPPRDQPVSGDTRFDCLVSTVAVDRVVFEVDGEKVEEDRRRPFRARLPLARPAKEQTVRVLAYDSLGEVMGQDTVVVNQQDVPFRVRITDFDGDPNAGSVQVAASVTVPAGTRLQRVEVYRNEALVETLQGSPIRVEVPTPDASAEDYIRVAAYLTDGSSIDDVVLLASPESVEEIDVNLVQLHVVVTDRDGRPVEDLRPEDFTVVYQGKRQQPQSFAYADDVPLVMGLLVDSSGSMELLMHDTRRAAAKFLGTTVLPQDRAFLVDFDLQPRLLHDVSGDLPSLMRALGQLNADGRTAMYDAVVFSLLQFEGQTGRRALVVLTDGDDLDSRFGPKQCAEMAQNAGVPVYLIGLGALDTLQRTYSKRDLRRVTGDTGGRLYFVDTFDELAGAYAEINAELRSQYSLSFYVDADLGEDERRKVRVEVEGDGYTARTVVGVGGDSP
ncbi:MAG: VWA domain-containing protein [Acidobacteriota bacterium]